jgi:hypothetical protein
VFTTPLLAGAVQDALGGLKQQGLASAMPALRGMAGDAAENPLAKPMMMVAAAPRAVFNGVVGLAGAVVGGGREGALH